jgi:hypothetical protein
MQQAGAARAAWVARICELRAETATFHRMILQLGGGVIVTFAVGLPTSSPLSFDLAFG